MAEGRNIYLCEQCGKELDLACMTVHVFGQTLHYCSKRCKDYWLWNRKALFQPNFEEMV